MTAPNDQNPTANRNIGLTLPTALVERLDAVAARLLIGRNLIAERGLEAIVAHLESMSDPLANLRVSSGPEQARPDAAPAPQTG